MMTKKHKVKNHKTKKRVFRKPPKKSYAQLRAEATQVQYDYLVERHVIKPSHAYYGILDDFAHKANNLYNQALYRARQGVFHNDWQNYYALNASFKKSRDQRDCMLYECMGNIHLAQQIIRCVADAMTSWKKARDEYNKHPHRFTGRPKLPNYHKKGGTCTLLIDAQTAKLRKGGVVEIPALNGFRVALQHKETTAIKQVRIVPQHNRFVVEIVYKTNKTIVYKPDNGRYLGIDPGVDNLFAIASNVAGFQPVLINGRPLKSINQYYNKARAHLHAIHKLCKQDYSSKRLDRLEFKRDQKIYRYAHEASKCIVDIALSHDINTIVIGHNVLQKQSSDIGRKNNQNFVAIPHKMMIDMIKYKANLHGIVVIETEESYTSQTSFLDNEMPVKMNGNKARKKNGKSPIKRRVQRGLYRADIGRYINSDVNAALQIIKKVVPDAYRNGIEGIGLSPVKLNLKA